MKLLYITASPRDQRSYSIRVADAFLAAYQAKRPDVTVVKRDLFVDPLIPFGADAAAGKYAIMHGTPASPAAEVAFAEVKKVIDEFASADFYLFAIPMWNFGIPYVLKHYFDVIVQPSYTFTVNEQGYAGLLQGKTAVPVFAQGGDYSTPATAGYDHQKPYAEMILGFMGIQQVHSLVVGPTLAAGREVAEEKLKEAIAAAQALAAKLAGSK